MHEYFLIVSLQANIRNYFFDQGSPQHPEGGVLPSADRQTNKQTEGHGDSMTELAQRADSVNILVVFTTKACIHLKEEARIGNFTFYC